jgi:energy-converting hydrogenase Eha subunit H
MAGPSSNDQQQVPAYVALVRIAAVIGMSAAAAVGIFLIVGGWAVPWGLIALVLALPWFGVMRLVENTAGPPAEPPA